MSQSRLIELTYYDSGKTVRLVAYADTIILERDGDGSTIKKAVHHHIFLDLMIQIQ